MMISDVKRLSAVFYGVSKAEIEGPGRMAILAWPRQVAMSLCRSYCRASLKKIAGAFNRDHTTVLHAIRTTAERIKEDALQGREIFLLREQIEAGAISEFSVWAQHERSLWIREKGQHTPLLERRADRAEPTLLPTYAQALAAANANFAIRIPANAPERGMRDLPGPRLLLVRGPGALSFGDSP